MIAIRIISAVLILGSLIAVARMLWVAYHRAKIKNAALREVNDQIRVIHMEINSGIAGVDYNLLYDLYDQRWKLSHDKVLR